MNSKQKFILALIAVMAGCIAVGCARLQARDHLNKGVQAFKNARYAEAVEHFKTSVELDPEYPVARLYLATAYMSQYIPGAESKENMEFNRMAKEEFLKVLEKNPSDKTAVASMASLHYSQAQGLSNLDDKLKKLDEAKVWYQKMVEVDPNNKEAYYSLGVIVWAKWYPALMAARVKLNMKAEDPGPLKDKKLKAELKEKWAAMVDDGLASLKKALDIDKEYDDAMAYVNLLVREKADLADSSEEYNKMIEEANGWVEKALATKKIKAARQPANTGIITEK